MKIANLSRKFAVNGVFAAGWILRLALFAWAALEFSLFAAEVAIGGTLRPGEFLDRWLVLKPIPVAGQTNRPLDDAMRQQAFAADGLVSEGGEARVEPRAGMKLKTAGQTLKWERLNLASGVADLLVNGHPMNDGIAYAWTEFSVPEKQTALLGLGSDDGVKVWLNGKLVHEHWVSRPVRVDDDLVPVELQPGKNQLLLKVQNGVGPWGFACRILSEEQVQGSKLIRANLEASGFNALTDADIKTMLRDNIDTDKESVGLAVGIVDEHGPRVVSHGKLDNGTDREVDGDTLFAIGSITKVFTALLLQDMVERGEMRLDDPVQKYLLSSVRMPTYQGKQITLLHLATHTSGLPRDDDGDLYAFLSHCTLHQAPGMRQEYSNLGMGLLGHVIALKAGKDYETLVVERICQPLGMDSTQITLPPQLKARLAIGHAMPGHRVQGFSSPRHETDARAPNVLGAGALHSTANDLVKFISAYAGLSPSPLSSLMRKAQEVHSLESGGRLPLVWFQYGAILEHGGLVDGYQAELAFDVNKRRGIVVLSNCEHHSTIVPAIWRPLLEGRSPKPARTSPSDAARYDRYVGQYQDQNRAKWIVRRDGGRLVVQWLGAPDVRIHTPSFEVFPQSASVFYNVFWEVQALFLPVEEAEPPQVVLASLGPGGPGWDPVKLTRISTDVPEPPAPFHLASRSYDGYAGRFRKSLLFGLLHLGPTLSISHEKDELGDHLFASVRGYGRAEIFPKNETAFIPGPSASGDLHLTFVRNRKGEANGVIVYWNGAKHRGARVSDKPTE